MDPQKQFCHNMDCPARGKIGEGNISIHSRTESRYKCSVCNKTFSHAKDTLFYRLHKPAELVTLVLTLLCHGCPVQAIVAAFGIDERTVSGWMDKAGSHAHKVHESLVQCQQIELGVVQADEMWVKLVTRKVWMAMAMAVPSRLWLGGIVSASRDRVLIRQVAQMARSCAANLGIVLCVDGLQSYIKTFIRAFSHKITTGQKGRPSYRPDVEFVIGQVIKKHSGYKLREVIRNAAVGSGETIAARIRELGCGSDINTSFIERLNAGFRSRWSGLVRRGRAIAHRQELVENAMWLVGCTYNFCLAHDSLRVLSGRCDGSKWTGRTPAMAAGITDHQWSVWELLWYSVPLPEWVQPKKKGRPRTKEPKQPRFKMGRPGRPPNWMVWRAEEQAQQQDHA